MFSVHHSMPPSDDGMPASRAEAIFVWAVAVVFTGLLILASMIAGAMLLGG
jgi:hypothetical protein